MADGAEGGTKPYTFSKVSGPEWIAVAADGTVSGMPTALGANADLVIKVTDSAVPSDSKEITLKVGNTYVIPADREVISVIRATSNIRENIGYGKPLFKPTFVFTEGAQANVSRTMGRWYKKEGTAWKRYEEATFTEGIYKYNNQIRVDDEGCSRFMQSGRLPTSRARLSIKLTRSSSGSPKPSNKRSLRTWK